MICWDLLQPNKPKNRSVSCSFIGTNIKYTESTQREAGWLMKFPTPDRKCCFVQSSFGCQTTIMVKNPEYLFAVVKIVFVQQWSHLQQHNCCILKSHKHHLTFCTQSPHDYEQKPQPDTRLSHEEHRVCDPDMRIFSHKILSLNVTAQHP